MLQRVAEARVDVESKTVARIGAGILVLVGVQADDDAALAEQFVERLLNYRVFADDEGRMNRSVREIGGGLLLVPQFTLAANPRKGRRPSFTSAASPVHGQAIFDHMAGYASSVHDDVAAGVFGADMQVYLLNDGPVTFILD